MSARIIVLAERRKSLRRAEPQRPYHLVWSGIFFGSALFWVAVGHAVFTTVSDLTRSAP
jgi:hypothetical protein